MLSQSPVGTGRGVYRSRTHTSWPSTGTWPLTLSSPAQGQAAQAHTGSQWPWDLSPDLSQLQKVSREPQHLPTNGPAKKPQPRKTTTKAKCYTHWGSFQLELPLRPGGRRDFLPWKSLRDPGTALHPEHPTWSDIVVTEQEHPRGRRQGPPGATFGELWEGLPTPWMLGSLVPAAPMGVPPVGVPQVPGPVELRRDRGAGRHVGLSLGPTSGGRVFLPEVQWLPEALVPRDGPVTPAKKQPINELGHRPGSE